MPNDTRDLQRLICIYEEDNMEYFSVTILDRYRRYVDLRIEDREMMERIMDVIRQELDRRTLLTNQ